MELFLKIFVDCDNHGSLTSFEHIEKERYDLLKAQDPDIYINGKFGKHSEFEFKFSELKIWEIPEGHPLRNEEVMKHLPYEGILEEDN